MPTSRIILIAADIPAASAFTLEQWQDIADAMSTLTTDELQALKRHFRVTDAEKTARKVSGSRF